MVARHDLFSISVAMGDRRFASILVVMGARHESHLFLAAIVDELLLARTKARHEVVSILVVMRARHESHLFLAAIVARHELVSNLGERHELHLTSAKAVNSIELPAKSMVQFDRRLLFRLAVSSHVPDSAKSLVALRGRRADAVTPWQLLLVAFFSTVDEVSSDLS